jgi:hypothetical protein
VAAVSHESLAMNRDWKVAVGVRVQGVADLDRQLADPLNDRLQGGHEREHDFAACLGLELTAATFSAGT